MPKKSIHDNINTVTNVLRDHQASGALCFLDQEKAYDRVDWDYLELCLEFYGIDKTFIKWTRKLLSASCFKVIGPSFTTTGIFPQRGLKQGDPMSPILYNFSINPLLTQLESLSGISIYGQPTLKILAFADDCVLGLKDANDSLKADSIISQYELASQAKLNSNKSLAISKCDSPFSLFRNIKYTNDPVKHLGILICKNGTLDEAMEATLLNKMQSRISLWANFRPSIKGKVLLLNIFISSKI